MNKIADDQWPRILRYYAEEVSIPVLAKRFGVSVEAIRQGIKKRNASLIHSLHHKRKNVTCGISASPN